MISFGRGGGLLETKSFKIGPEMKEVVEKMTAFSSAYSSEQ